MNSEQFYAPWLVEALIRASWQGALLAGGVWIVCQCFPRLPASARTWLWRLVLLKMIFALLWLRPLELELLPAQTVVSTPPIPEAVASAPSASSAPQPSVSTTPAQTPWRIDWRLLAAMLWAIGVTFALGRGAVHFRRANLLRRAASRCTEERLLRLLIPLTREIGLPGLPRLRLSTTATRPMLVGIFQPTLIFPANIIAASPPESLRMMFAHELAHIRRGDLPWTVFAALVQSFFFFHPAAWLARREAILAQEIACDELAVRATSSAPASYAEMLVEIVSTSSSFSTAPKIISLGIADHRKTLERRIRSMKFIEHRKTKTMQFLAAAAVTAAFLALVPIRLIAAKPDRLDTWPESKPAVHPFEPGGLVAQLRDKPRNELRRILPSLVQDRILNQYLQDLSAKEREYAALQFDYSDDHPVIGQISAVLATINRQIESRIDGILAGLKLQAMQDEKASKPSATGVAQSRELYDLEIGPSASIAVYARTGGMVEQVLVKVGENVKAGQVLIVMDDFTARARISSAEARSRVAAADLRIAKADFKDSERILEAKKNLFERGVTALSSLPNLEKAKAQVIKAEALLEVARIDQEKADNALGHYQLEASADGVVTSIIHPGYFVPEGGGKVLAVIAKDKDAKNAEAPAEVRR